MLHVHICYMKLFFFMILWLVLKHHWSFIDFGIAGVFTCFLLQEGMDNKVLTNDDVLGDAIPYDQQDAMRHLCYQFLDLMPPTVLIFWHYTQFVE